MRRSTTGDYYAESIDDDIGEAFMAAELEPSECYASINQVADGFEVEILGNQDGETIVTSDDGMFPEYEAAFAWAKSWVSDVQKAF